MLTSILIKNE
jgi:hypothetical protein